MIICRLSICRSSSVRRVKVCNMVLKQDRVIAIRQLLLPHPLTDPPPRGLAVYLIPGIPYPPDRLIWGLPRRLSTPVVPLTVMT